MYKICLLLFIFIFNGCDNYLVNPVSFNISNINEDDLLYRNSFIYKKYLQISIGGETDFYIADYIFPDHAPYVMEIDVIAKTNSKEKINWYTNKEYYTDECGDYEECPLIFDLMADSTSYTNKRFLSKNKILVSPEFVQDTIYIYSYIVHKNNIYYGNTLKLFLTW